MSNFNNSNYGYAVATDQTYIAITNPSNFSYNSNFTGSGTGSVELLQYNIESNSYIHKDTIRKYIDLNTVIATENLDNITTDTGSIPNTSYELLYESDNLNLSASKFGISVALSNNVLAIGDPIFYYKATDSSTLELLSGSSVDLYSVTGSVSTTASFITSISNSFETDYSYNTTFGESISLYYDVLAIGASSISSSTGAVYLFKNSASLWVYHQTLTGSVASTGSKFGGVVKIDQSGSYNIVVGNKATGSGTVYVFNYNSSSGYWTQGSILSSDRNITASLQLVNHNWPPYITASTNPDAYGNSVAIYGTSIAVGAPTDTIYTEYSGSTVSRQRGAVYFYENCTDDNINWRLVQKSFGSNDILKTNYFGWDVELYNTSSIVSSLKMNWPFSSSYIENTLNKKFDCNPNDIEYNVIGQLAIYQKSSGSWDILSTVTKNKQYGESYKLYGYDISLFGNSFVVGSPVIWQ
jgi:hypothetical protein